jgi:hypothetical protein
MSVVHVRATLITQDIATNLVAHLEQRAIVKLHAQMVAITVVTTTLLATM